MGANKKWSVDIDKNTASHDSGLTVRLSGGEVIDILQMPDGLKTRDLPVLLDEAAAAYKRQKTGAASSAATPPPSSGPRKSKLSLGKRK